MMRSSEVESPIGPIHLVSNGQALVQIVLPGSQQEPVGAVEGEDAVLAHAKKELRQYFEGRRTQFTVPIHVEGTEFQEAAWEALRAIPYGETRSYGDQAQAIGKPGAARAVGQANRRNPLPILVPCHRVQGAGGSIGGYMGKWGEMDGIKQWLLNLESGARMLPAQSIHSG